MFVWHQDEDPARLQLWGQGLRAGYSEQRRLITGTDPSKALLSELHATSGCICLLWAAHSCSRS